MLTASCCRQVRSVGHGLRVICGSSRKLNSGVYYTNVSTVSSRQDEPSEEKMARATHQVDVPDESNTKGGLPVRAPDKHVHTMVNGSKSSTLTTASAEKEARINMDAVSGDVSQSYGGSVKSKATTLDKLPPEPPTMCCMSGCHNCVWIAYADEMAEFYKDGGTKAIAQIKEHITDPMVREFVLMELSTK